MNARSSSRKPPAQRPDPVRRALLESRVGTQMAARMNLATLQLAPDVQERLRFAREQALARARQVERSQALASSPSSVAAQGSVRAPTSAGRRGLGLALGSAGGLWLRVAAAVPAVMLVAGLIGIEHYNRDAQIRAAAEVDAALLADDTLPQAAYRDPGFRAYMQPPGSGL